MQGYNCHKNKIRTNEPKFWKNYKNTEAQPKLSGSYEKKVYKIVPEFFFWNLFEHRLRFTTRAILI